MFSHINQKDCIFRIRIWMLVWTLSCSDTSYNISNCSFNTEVQYFDFFNKSFINSYKRWNYIAFIINRALDHLHLAIILIIQIISLVTKGAKASVKSQLDSYRGNPNNPILLYHIIPTKLPSDHFEANTVVETRHAGNFLRINKYSNGVRWLGLGTLDGQGSTKSTQTPCEGGEIEATRLYRENPRKWDLETCYLVRQFLQNLQILQWSATSSLIMYKLR